MIRLVRHRSAGEPSGVSRRVMARMLGRSGQHPAAHAARLAKTSLWNDGRWLRTAIVVGLSLYLLFAHGCHSTSTADLLLR